MSLIKGYTKEGKRGCKRTAQYATQVYALTSVKKEVACKQCPLFLDGIEVHSQEEHAAVIYCSIPMQIKTASEDRQVILSPSTLLRIAKNDGNAFQKGNFPFIGSNSRGMFISRFIVGYYGLIMYYQVTTTTYNWYC